MLCPQVLHGLANSLAQTGYAPSRDYDVIVASIDPSDTPADAAAARQKFVAQLGGDVPADSVHFLTGAQPEITALADSIGFHYVRVPGPDGKMTQFAHSSVIMVATPEGKLSKYLTGVEYQPRDLRLALLEASDHRIGSPTRSDPALLLQLFAGRGPLHRLRAARARAGRHGIGLWTGGDALYAGPQAEGEDRSLRVGTSRAARSSAALPSRRRSTLSLS